MAFPVCTTAAQTAEPIAALRDRPTAAPVACPVCTMVAQTAGPMVAQTAEPIAALRDRPTAAPVARPVCTVAAQTAEPMVAQTAGPMVAQTAGPMAAQTEAPSTLQPALDRLIGIGVEEFACDYWGRQELLTPAGAAVGGSGFGAGFSDLLDADAVDELVSERGLRTPFLRVARDGTTLGDSTFTAPGGVGATIGDQVSDDSLVRLFADGSTMVLQALHRVWPPVVAFCQQLASELGHPVQANAYVTPPQNQGFSDHYDVHDVFVLQISGEKWWRIHAPVLEAPLRDQPWTDRRAAVERRAAEPPSIEAVLRPGDCLYLPRGYLHAATALGGVSTHLTIGVHSWTRFAVAEQLLAQALRRVAQDPDLRHSLPLGVDFSDTSTLRPEVERAKYALVAALTGADSEAVAQALLAS